MPTAACSGHDPCIPQMAGQSFATPSRRDRTAGHAKGRRPSRRSARSSTSTRCALRAAVARQRNCKVINVASMDDEFATLLQKYYRPFLSHPRTSLYQEEIPTTPSTKPIPVANIRSVCEFIIGFVPHRMEKPPMPTIVPIISRRLFGLLFSIFDSYLRI